MQRDLVARLLALAGLRPIIVLTAFGLAVAATHSVACATSLSSWGWSRERDSSIRKPDPDLQQEFWMMHQGADWRMMIRATSVRREIYWIPHSSDTTGYTKDAQRLQAMYESALRRPAGWITYSISPTWKSYALEPSPTGSVATPFYLDVHIGWPRPCLRYGVWTNSVPPLEGGEHAVRKQVAVSVEDGVRVSSPLKTINETRVIPYGVLWPALVGNILTFWGTIMGLAVVCCVLRMLTRLLRHRCIGCAYDLRGLTTDCCPECGLAACDFSWLHPRNRGA